MHMHESTKAESVQQKEQSGRENPVTEWNPDVLGKQDTGVPVKDNTSGISNVIQEAEKTPDTGSVPKTPKVIPEDPKPPDEHREPSAAKRCQSEKEQVLQNDMVQFKLSLLSPAIFQTHTEKSDRAYFEKISQKVYQLPDGSLKKFSIKTLERWLRDYKQEHDVYSLARKSRSDDGVCRKLPLAVQSRIVEILHESPTSRCTTLQNRLFDEGLLSRDDVSVDTIRRYVRINEIREQLLQGVAEEEIRMSFIEKEAGNLWEADTCYLWKISDSTGKKKRWVYVQGIIDNHSRLIVAANCYLQDNALNFQNTFRCAVARYHIPSKLYTDNGSPYVNKDLKRICNNLSVALIHTRANDGASKGVIERAWLSCEINLQLDLVLDHVDTLEEVQELVDKWVVKYNSRVNRGVNGIPIERYLASEARHPLRKAESSTWLSNAFCHAALRSVTKVGTVQQANRHFRVPDALRKEKKVWIYYDPQDVLNSIHVEVDGKTVYLKEDDPEENAGKKRNHGGRTAELQEKAAKKKQEKMTAADARAEARFKKRMRGTGLFDEESDKENSTHPDSVETANLYDAEAETCAGNSSFFDKQETETLHLFETETSESRETVSFLEVDYTIV